MWRWRARRTGKSVDGVVTESTTNSTVNNVPRWRIVVRFVDSARLPVTVHFDPARPGDKRRIVVDF